MNENNYLIQFNYAGETYHIHTLSHNDLSHMDKGVEIFVASQIEDYINSNNLHKEGAKVSDACLFGKGGALIACVHDFAKGI